MLKRILIVLVVGLLSATPTNAGFFGKSAGVNVGGMVVKAGIKACLRSHKCKAYTVRVGMEAVEGLLEKFGTTAVLACVASDTCGRLAANGYDLAQGAILEHKGSNGVEPKGLPSGVRPIDKDVRVRGKVHAIKDGIGAGPNDWTGIAPDGTIWTGEAGIAVPAGHYTDYGH